MSPYLLGALLLAAVLMTPLRLEAELTLGEALSGQVVLRAWGAPLRWAFRTGESGGALRLLIRGGRRDAPEHPARPAWSPGIRVLAGTALRCDQARRLLRRGVRLLGLKAQVRLAGASAARVAWGTGALQAAAAWLPPQARLCCAPDFWSGRGALSLRAAAEARLGVLFAAVSLVGLAYWAQRRVHRK